MSLTIRPSASGRVIVETDGFDDFYGAYAQGAAVCKRSAPATVTRSYTDRDGIFDFRSFLADVRSAYARPAGVRVHALRWIQ